MNITKENSAIWKSKEGEVFISEMTNEHLQKAYNSAEYRFMKYENQAIACAEIAALFEQKMVELEKEARNRKIEIASVSQKSQEKFGILRNRRKVKAME
ncbi:MAG: hypothetical protein PWQ54_1398 [Bacteroidales bacterium]|jgi:hypothetical protein|nr:hypothetical protein [Bacteroidales bacterium]